MNSIIRINDLSAAYDGNRVLSQVNLTVYERDFLGIIGPNGGGKKIGRASCRERVSNPV